MAEALEATRSDRVSLAIEDVRLTLQGAKARGWPFAQAWTAAINRVQPKNSQEKGVVLDPVETAELAEARALLEEDRIAFQACYEDRAMTPLENAQRILAASRRLGLAA